MPEIKYFLEMLKIVSGAINSDRKKVVEYSNYLANQLESEGEISAARRLRRILTKSAYNELQTSGVTTTRIPVDSESHVDLADHSFYDTDDIKLFMEENLFIQLHEFIELASHRSKLLAEGVEIPPSLLVFGPPGCGKTELAKYVAAHLAVPLLTIRIDSLISSYLGSTAKNIRRVFDYASSRPCVLFLDEFDAVAKKRDDSQELGELKRVVVSLLQNIDNLNAETVLIAATNHEHLLDSAIWRRFTYKINIDVPSDNIRELMFGEYLSAYAPKDKKQLLVAVSEGLSGADIKTLCQAAISRSILNNKKKIDSIEFTRTILQFKNPTVFSLSPQQAVQQLYDLQIPGLTQKLIGSFFSLAESTTSKYLHKEE